MPAHDASSSATQLSTASLTWSHTCTGANRLLTVKLALGASVPAASTGVTYAGVALTSQSGATNGFVREELWTLIAPATGANNIVASLGTTSDVIGSASSYTDVHQTTPLRTPVPTPTTGTSTAPSLTVTSASGELVVDGVGADTNVTATVGAGQTERTNAAAGTNTRGASSEETGAASVVMDWTLASSQQWVMVGASMQAPAAAADLPYHPWPLRGPILAQ